MMHQTSLSFISLVCAIKLAVVANCFHSSFSTWKFHQGDNRIWDTNQVSVLKSTMCVLYIWVTTVDHLSLKLQTFMKPLIAMYTNSDLKCSCYPRVQCDKVVFLLRSGPFNNDIYWSAYSVERLHIEGFSFSLFFLRLLTETLWAMHLRPLVCGFTPQGMPLWQISLWIFWLSNSIFLNR